MGVAAALLLAVGEGAFAQDSGGCLLHPAKLPDTAVKGFQDRPADVLANHPGGGPLMSGAVRRLAGSEISTVPALVSLAREANPAQIVAIGAGLAAAAAVCKRLRPDLERRIREEVEKAAIPALSAAFAAGLSQDDIAAVGGTGGPITNGDLIANLQPAGGGGSDAPGGRRRSNEVFPDFSFGIGGVNRAVVSPP